MKKIESFTYYTGNPIADTTAKVNERLVELSKERLGEVEINISTTQTSVIYTLIYDISN